MNKSKKALKKEEKKKKLLEEKGESVEDPPSDQSPIQINRNRNQRKKRDEDLDEAELEYKRQREFLAGAKKTVNEKDMAAIDFSVSAPGG